MITHAPAPVTDKPKFTVSQAKRRSGLMGMKPGSEHMISIGDRLIGVKARSNEEAIGKSAHYVCLHERCAGKTYGSLVDLYEKHPPPSEMAKREEAHVFGLWSDDPADPGAIEAAKIALGKAEKALKRAQDAKQDEEAIEALAEKLNAAKGALEASKAPLGLIAPPEPKIEDL